MSQRCDRHSLIIAGGRKFKDVTLLHESLCDYEAIHGTLDEIVCGKAEGADTLGEEWGKLNGVPIKYFPAKWKDTTVENCVVKVGKYGTYNAIAGHNRNAEMAEYALALIAFWDGRSSGTKDMINRMKALGKRVVVILY